MVRIQIYCAIITYCLVAIVQHDMELERSIYEIIRILGLSLTDKTICAPYSTNRISSMFLFVFRSGQNVV